MKWFIACLIIIFINTGILIGYTVSITFYFVETAIDDHNYNNLLILYKVGK